MTFTNTIEWYWVDYVVSTLTFIIQTTCFIIHSLVLCQSANIITFCTCCGKHSTSNEFLKHKLHGKYQKLAAISTFFILFFYFIYGGIIIFTRIDSIVEKTEPRIECFWAVKLGSIAYQIAKGFIYCLFILRLDIAYHGSQFAYKRSKLHAFLLFLVLYTISLVLLAIVTVEGKAHFYNISIFERKSQKQSSVTGINDHYICETVIPLYLLAYMVIMDITFSIICMYLFIHPLKKILAQNISLQTMPQLPRTITFTADSKLDFGNSPSTSPRKSIKSTSAFNHRSMSSINTSSTMRMSSVSGTENVSNEFRSLIVKYVIITSVGLCSTFIALVVIGITDAPAFSMPDVWVNTFCILLMCAEYRKWYYKFCCVCIRCVSYATLVQSKLKSAEEDFDLNVHHLEQNTTTEFGDVSMMDKSCHYSECKMVGRRATMELKVKIEENAEFPVCIIKDMALSDANI